MAHYNPVFESLLEDDDVITYKTTTRYLVEELMELVVLSGSNKENVRVGNPYDIDFMIQYDINVTDVIEDIFHLRFVQLRPGKNDCIKFSSMLNCQGQLISDRLMFTFFKIIFHITNQSKKYLRKKLRLRLDLTFKVKEINESNFRTLADIGVALPLQVVTDGYARQIREHIDLVLSLHSPSYWPTCAAGWIRDKSLLDETCFQQILDHGVSFVCKVPDPKLFESQ